MTTALLKLKAIKTDMVRTWRKEEKELERRDFKSLVSPTYLIQTMGDLPCVSLRPSSRKSAIFYHWSDRGIVRVFFCYSAVVRVVQTPSLPSSMVRSTAPFDNAFYFHSLLKYCNTAAKSRNVQFTKTSQQKYIIYYRESFHFLSSKI